MQTVRRLSYVSRKEEIVKNTITVTKSICAFLLLTTISACGIKSTGTNPTKIPHETASPFPSPMPTLLPTITLTPPQKAYKTFSSPNNDWTVSIYSPIDHNAPQFTTSIIKVDGGFEWILNYRTSQFEEEAYYSPFYWTNDGQYLFLVITRAMDGCGKVLEFYTGSGLFKLDLNTGELSEIVPEMHLASYAFSISPSEKMLANAKEGETPITIRVKDISGTNENSFTLDKKYQGAGNFIWFPSEEAILFVAKEEVCGSKPSYTLITLNLSTAEMEVIFQNLDKNLTAVKWESVNILRMSDQEGKQWLLDLTSNQLELATVIP